MDAQRPNTLFLNTFISFFLLIRVFCKILHTDCTALHLGCNQLAQGWAIKIERAIKGGQSSGLMRAAAGMTLDDSLDANLTQAKLPRAAARDLHRFCSGF